MLKRIQLEQVASFTTPTALETDKKVNLIYGLNGTGKSTLSNYLYSLESTEFSACQIDGIEDTEILVYNQQFIQDFFYEDDSLKGVFTLSKDNKDAREQIKRLEIKKLGLVEKREQTQKAIADNKERLSKQLTIAAKTTWNIKSTYSGGDRVLEYCLTGLMGDKEKLFNYLISVKKPDKKPLRTTVELKSDVEAIAGEEAQKYSELPTITFKQDSVESNPVFESILSGNESSVLHALIEKLDNSDWVRQGIGFLPEPDVEFEKDSLCPFCQSPTISNQKLIELGEYFDETYEASLKEIKTSLNSYQLAVDSLPSIEDLSAHPVLTENHAHLQEAYALFKSVIDSNLTQIKAKINTPSRTAKLASSATSLNSLNQTIATINSEIQTHNQKIDNRDQSIENIKVEFWAIMRWEYDQTITAFNATETSLRSTQKQLQETLSSLTKSIDTCSNDIAYEQKNTVNIEEAITHINATLFELGITGFNIIKYSDDLYRVVREGTGENTFSTLSEGEKMIISFLYFRELCKGKSSPTAQETHKVIVIDDPISSLSHVYIFNIGQFLKNEFFNSPEYNQIFVLTHSLYFFYELADAKHDRRRESQKLFRMYKNSAGSKIVDMRYDEIQNDYHSYWHIIKDESQHAALIANAMRNIVEYFFGFIEKLDLNNLFQKPALQHNKFQAFYRYINRESHSIGQNIYDTKEFDYEIFLEGLRLVFKESGYEDHYIKMIGQ